MMMMTTTMMVVVVRWAWVKQGVEEESPPPQPTKPAAQSPKRPAETAPQGSPAKKPNTGGGSDETAGYIKKLHEYLKSNGKQSMGQLGSKVPRPNGVPKLKVILDQNKEKFTVVGDVITAK